MHEQIRRAIGTGWTPAEWREVAVSHPVLRRHLAGDVTGAHTLLREYTAAHEAGHAVVGMLVGAKLRRVEIAHLHEIEQSGTVGFNEYTWPWSGRRTVVSPPEGERLVAELLMDLGGIAGHEVIYNNGWGLDAAAWTDPTESGSLRGEAEVGGDLYEARKRVRGAILHGERVLGRATTADALLAAYEQAEGLLVGRRGTLLRLAGHLLAYGKADRTVIEACWGVGE